MHTSHDNTRIDVRRIAKLFAVTVGIPLFTGIFIDVFFGTAPMATIVLGFVAIPLASVLVLRFTLSEFDRVIAQVAPKLEPEQRRYDGDDSWIGTGLFEDDPQDTGLFLVADTTLRPPDDGLTGKTETEQPENEIAS